MSNLKKFFVLGLPDKENRCPNAVYFVKTGAESVAIYVTDKLKNAYQPTAEELKSEIRPFERIVGLADSVLDTITDVKEAARQSINTLTTPLDINKGTFPIIKFLFKSTTYRLALDVPQGTYGIGGNKLDSVNKIIIISKEVLNLGSVQESIRETVDLGVIGTSSIQDIVNQSTYSIRDLSLGYTAFKATQTVDGLEEEKIWLYTGNSGTIGIGGYTTQNTDYLPLDPSTSISEFTDDEQARLRSLIYITGTNTLAVSPTSFEKNLTTGTSITFNWNVQANDDTINTATFDATSISGNLVSNTIFNGIKQSLTKQLAVQFLNNLDGTTRNESISRTATAIDPQWKGSKATNTSLNGSTYASLGTTFTKFLQGGSSTSITVPANKYGIFLSINSNAIITENSTGFALAPTAYTKNTITVTYQDGAAYILTEYIVNTATAETSYTIN